MVSKSKKVIGVFTLYMKSGCHWDEDVEAILQSAAQIAANIIEQKKAEGGLLGRYNTAFTIFDLVNNHEHENKIKEERTSEHNINQPINFIISGEASELPQSENDIKEI